MPAFAHLFHLSPDEVLAMPHDRFRRFVVFAEKLNK